ncbi:rhamnogalacturonan acetylesterase [Paenibacillus sp. TRM 82003]|uniref:rhamnogalacturonan acetylesterase n=1 Tax=Kineococcus sp. TRM81007 TaxID=2925831 RepID=UPI001F5A8DC0|nr:rhamnogalacturonan acetylesterase [Kineococcus sp. TRM81007]MCI2239130.1 rhamnogalacturonan acetylesterase [Kineococcus sp. TRM81007]MCI3924810.1 rhamnogalacturonan acetylesterase [Paenibacillus sp. TRM 82003]
MSAPQRGPLRVHLAGDSTVAACPATEEPMSGWGAHLGQASGWAVRNLAVAGASTASFRQEGHWAELLSRTVEGDVVVLQFGHNDQKRPGELDARGGYDANLAAFVAEVRDAGARPVLCTSVARRRFTGAVLEPTLGEYPAAVRELAAREAVPLVDLEVFTSWWYDQLGPQRSTKLFVHLAPGEHPCWPDGLADDTHFSHRGARGVAAYVARALPAVLDGKGS